MKHRLSQLNWKWLGLSAYLVCGALVIMFTTPILGWRALNVLTPSMKPAIAPGALVLVHRVPAASLRPGQVVTYQDPHHHGVTITHRIVATGRLHGTPTVTTKGDANKVNDQPVPAGLVVGRVATVVPGLGRALGLFHNPAVLVLLIIIPGLVVILSELRHLRALLRSVPAAAGQIRRLRRLDGVYIRAGVLVLAVGMVALATGSTLAQLTSTASLTGNTFTAVSTTSPSPTPSPSGSPSPTPSPSASPCPTNISITDTGPGSTNIVRCTSSFSSDSSSSTSVSITSNSTQSATSGSITINGNTLSGTVTPGNITNSSSSSINVGISH
ncbi:MAG TPA: signal peptidase I [Candidatus Saccharimonadia bacterium]|jgi:signal peptidase I